MLAIKLKTQPPLNNEMLYEYLQDTSTAPLEPKDVYARRLARAEERLRQKSENKRKVHEYTELTKKLKKDQAERKEKIENNQKRKDDELFSHLRQ